MAESMLDALTAYYRSQRILSTQFACLHEVKCRGDCAAFTGPKSAFVSTGYERHDLPRLLFLSLDSGSGASVAKERLPAEVRKQEEEGFDVGSAHKGRHWYLTHEIAWCILRRFDSKIGLKEVQRYFAHANSAKCCQNKPGGGQADAKLFRNCGKYLPAELEVLAPDIIVTQGAKARDAIRRYSVQEIDPPDEWARIVAMNGREVFWLQTRHPARGWLARQFADRPTWKEEYAEMIREFAERQGWPGT